MNKDHHEACRSGHSMLSSSARRAMLRTRGIARPEAICVRRDFFGERSGQRASFRRLREIVKAITHRLNRARNLGRLMGRNILDD